MIEALASDRSDESFNIGVLPGGARRRQDFVHADGLQVIERMISIANEISRGPGGRGMFRDGDTHDAPAIMREQHQDEEELARRRRDHEEVGRDQLLRMIGQERAPGLRRPWPAADHVCGHGC